MPETDPNPVPRRPHAAAARAAAKGKLFAGFLTVAPSCTVCGLDYAFADAATARRSSSSSSSASSSSASPRSLEALFHPAPFVHLLLWIPAVIVLSLALLRPFKATMIALQYPPRRRRGPGQVTVAAGASAPSLVLMLALTGALRRARHLAARAPAREGSADRRGRRAHASQPPTPLPPLAEWVGFDSEVFDYRPVTVTGTFVPDRDRPASSPASATPTGQFSGPGYWVITPLALDGGGTSSSTAASSRRTSAPNFAAGADAPRRRSHPHRHRPHLRGSRRASPPAPTPPSASNGSATSPASPRCSIPR